LFLSPGSWCKLELSLGSELCQAVGDDFFFFKRNSNSLANQLGIYLILAKQEKLASNSLANQLGNRWEGEKKNREGFLM
jgi:hypothetical protein